MALASLPYWDFIYLEPLIIYESQKPAALTLNKMNQASLGNENLRAGRQE